MSFTTHQGGEGGVTITGKAYVTTSGTTSGTVAGTVMALCVQDWSANEERKTVSIMTTCDYDTLRQTTFENEREVSRGLTFDITAFSVDEVPEAALVDATTIGPIILKKYTTADATRSEGFYIPLAVCTAIPHGGAAAGEALQMFKLTGKAAGTFHRGIL